MSYTDKSLDGVGLARVNQILASRYVPKTTKVNNKPLSADIELSASDVGAVTLEQVNAAIATAISGAINASY